MNSGQNSDGERSGFEYLMSWKEAAAAGPGLAGGKGCNLGRLHTFGFNVPGGIVVCSAAYQAFIEANGLKPLMDCVSAGISSDNIQERAGELRKLSGAIMTGKLPGTLNREIESALVRARLDEKALAVRSSASLEDGARLSFAGIHDSFLNVKGRDQLVQAIKGCYASLWAPRALAYRRRFGVNDDDLLVAVVIMEMVPAVASGVAFSCDPRTGRRDRLVINATRGLGDALVGGAIEPDTYILDASPFHIKPPLLETTIGPRSRISVAAAGGGVKLAEIQDHQKTALPGAPALTEEEARSLGNLVIRVFDSLGEAEIHQDIEWAYDGQNFVLLQARPATALPHYTFDVLKNRTEVWSNGNYRDACPMVLSPLQRRMMKEFIDICQYQSFAVCEYPIPAGFQFARFFKGRLYCDTSALLWASYDCYGVLPSMYTPFWGGHHPDLEIEDAGQPSEDQARAWQQYNQRCQAAGAAVATHVEKYFAEMTAAIDSALATPWAEKGDEEFPGLFARASAMLDACSRHYMIYNSIGGLAFGGMMQLLHPHFGQETMAIVNGLMTGSVSGITSADHGYRLLELASLVRRDPAVASILGSEDFKTGDWERELPEESEFKESFRGFIHDFGHRALYELDIINPRWHEDPSYLFDIIRSAMNGPGLEQQRLAQQEARRRSRQKAAEFLAEDEMQFLEQLVSQAQEGAAVRENNKSILARGLEIYRRMAMEIGRRFEKRGLLDQSGDVFFCTWSELMSIFSGAWDGRGLAVLAAYRQESRRAYSEMEAPDYIHGQEPVFRRSHPHPEGNWLEGLGASAGQAAGSVRLISHPGQGSSLQQSEILVAPSTDPGWTPLFLNAAALIMETGGFLSHGAIVAREYGIPSVINVAGAMSHLRDGQPVFVDGDIGRVYLDYPE